MGDEEKIILGKIKKRGYQKNDKLRRAKKWERGTKKEEKKRTYDGNSRAAIPSETQEGGENGEKKRNTRKLGSSWCDKKERRKRREKNEREKEREGDLLGVFTELSCGNTEHIAARLNRVGRGSGLDHHGAISFHSREERATRDGTRAVRSESEKSGDGSNRVSFVGLNEE